MVPFVIYDTSSGAVLRSGFCSELDLESQIGDGEGLLQGVLSEHDDDVVIEGEIFTPPPRPARFSVFDVATMEWVDARSIEQKERDWAEQKTKAIGKINATIGTIRRSFVTDLPAQDMIYQAKLEEAKKYLSGPEPETLEDYPMIAAEVGITAETPYQLAVIWAYMADLWVRTAAQLESVRLRAIGTVERANSTEEIEGALEALNEALNQLGA